MRSLVLFSMFFLAVICLSQAQVSQSFNFSVANKTEPEFSCFPPSKTQCQDGILFPAWRPILGISAFDRSIRAVVYFVALCYLFLGVSIISDRFMAAIEVITSQERQVKVKKSDGSVEKVKVRIWNETVSNLTLMALGSSAPEILLSIIEICGKNFEAGELGPGTIVGSAAFNLFVIIGICCWVIPNDEVRKIKHLEVFLITGAWSIFAYLWMYLIIAQISEGVVELWEALLTFAFFPLTVLSAYIADTKIFFNKFLKRRFLRQHVKTYTKDGGDVEVKYRNSMYGSIEEGFDTIQFMDTADSEIEKHRIEYIDIIRDIRQRQPNIDRQKLEELAQAEALNKGHKSRAFYKIQSSRTLIGGGNVLRKARICSHSMEDLDAISEKPEMYENTVQSVYFNPSNYTVFENVGSMDVSVCRSGPYIDCTFAEVEYFTADGTANANEDYIPVAGKLIFQPGQTELTIKIAIIDDDIFEEDEHFFLQLKNLIVRQNPAIEALALGDFGTELTYPATATITILDDDHPGVFGFEVSKTKVPESIGLLEIKVTRSSGSRGNVRIPYKTVEYTATGGGVDYEDANGYLDFYNDQIEATIRLRIVDTTEYEKNKSFYVQLGEPVLTKKFSIFHLKINDIIVISHWATTVTKCFEREYRMYYRYEVYYNTVENSHAFNFVGDLGSRLTSRRRSSKANHTKSMEESDVKRQLSDVKMEGQARLGDNSKMEVQICESKELKNVVDHLMRKGQIAELLGTSSWREQFKDAFSVETADNDNDPELDNTEKLSKNNCKASSCSAYIMHYISLFWKVIFACVPPTDIWGGWLCFIVSIIVIGVLTAIIGDVASGFGCSVGLTDTVTAITFVALGTSLPDTFASKVAALSDPTADSSIGNVVGSNAVNVYLGIGIAWTIAALYHQGKGEPFRVSSGSLGFSVTIFCALAFIGITVLLLRRRASIGGELGGPKKEKYATVALFFGLWFVYILLSSLENYCHIPGF